jgi:hypothetical protein
MRREVRPSPDVVSQELEGEVVLVNLHTNRIFALNRTGARLWQLLTSGADRTGIQRELEREFDVDPVLLDREIDLLLEHLAAEGLVISAA